MGTNSNFKNFEHDMSSMVGDGGGGFSFPLTRQPSVYALTFDEFQNAVGATGKDFGSMNMDELLKNIWGAEENQNIGSTSDLNSSGQEMGGSLHRQGSLILSRRLSLKTVDEVWRDMSKEYIGGTDPSGGVGGFSMSQREPTLGQMSLEEFLMRAGAVRGETGGSQLDGNSNIVVSLNDLAPPLSSNLDFRFGYQQANGNGGLVSGGGIGESSIQMATQCGTSPLSVNVVKYPAYELGNQQQQQQLLPKQPALAYPAPMAVPSNGQSSSPRMGEGIIGMTDTQMNNTMVQNNTLPGAGLGILGLGANNVTIETGYPAVSTDGLTKGNGEASSVSPLPYMFNGGGLRGRKVAAVEKIVERRHRRMIKNRESAARSRARKQAYTMELESEVAKLKEENQELHKKEADMIEIQKKQVLEMMKKHQKNGTKRRCLRRMCTGPW